MQARLGAATRYQRTAAAVDEATQTNPIVPLFYPAVRECAIARLRFGRCHASVNSPGFRSRLIDAIAWTGRRGISPAPADGLGVRSNAAVARRLHTDYSIYKVHAPRRVVVAADAVRGKPPFPGAN